MVGYEKSDPITISEKFVAGCISGCITRFMTQPMDVLKVKIQLSKSQKKVNSMYVVLVNILRNEGITAFWQGHNLGQLHSVTSISAQFYIYEMTTKYVTYHPYYRKKYKPLAVFLCGALSGSVSATLVCPLEVIRLRQMLVKEQYKGLYRGASAVYKNGGILAFYEGLSASLLQMSLQIGIAFVVFSYVQDFILANFTKKCDGAECKPSHGNQYDAQYLLLASTVAGSASGFVSKSLTYPFDLFKRRLQIASHREQSHYLVPASSKDLVKCSNLRECFRKTIYHEGFRGLYRGYSVTVLKSQITSMFAFTSYELTCYVIREFIS